MDQQLVPEPVEWRSANLFLSRAHRSFIAREMDRRGITSPSAILSQLIEAAMAEEARSRPPVPVNVAPDAHA